MAFSKFLSRQKPPAPSSAAVADPAHSDLRGDGERIYLVSMASYPNYGDELIARTWLRYLAEVKPAAEVWLDCRHPASASVLFRGDHPHLTTTDTLFRVLDLASQEWEQRSITDIVTDLGSPLFDLQIAEMNRATTLHLLGGGFLNSQWPLNLGLLEGMRASAAVSGARLIATGQGLTPNAGADFDGFAHVSVRDRESAALASLEAGLDDAFLGLPPAGMPLGDVNEVVVCVQSDAVDEESFEGFLDVVEDALKDPALAHARLTYAEALPGADYRGYEALSQRGVNFGRFVPFSEFWTAPFRFAPGQFWITSRFHHHLVAASRGARGFALVDAGEYYSTKHGSLIELGSGWLPVRPGEALPAVADTQGQHGFDEAHSQKRREADALYRN
ncbi:Polysaccharide pyruvyl transferase [Mycobacteroides abscessus subsp. abscessus]|uniref:polysaccharide pyruvyl transferase family protein n=1 Tax=Dermabacter vaginalis TaxID=1630135 RepID=UPI00092B700C|nr:polysaccharide pyruvyl transferase family protein [Dermabacter vaginalis]MCG7443519.1 polysaccharide pyruvyl transferase family protein [Dermabacter vaginalis]SHW80167.1 Polysaccharide pyruvyl transferase [Mycobacteroides abscessus subsp. abscessus]